ncbi:unnamed protein product [Prorocentrum cordatum]|uniref:FHA domain-containing protein n=1 Tax=Prorocentrum cordatum TaxID=2364126 RepID=A0ABN9U2Z4_9DINO|nr:unnamed protein product [Polarella glacialis]
MVLLELLTGAPPAVPRPDRPHEFCYLVDYLQGRVAKVIQMLDPSSQFPLTLAEVVTETAFRCIQQRPEERPLFKQLVEELRQLLQASDAYAGGAPVGQSALVPARPAVPAQPAPQAGVKRLMAGSSVECRWRGGTGWFPGRVERVNQNGTFAVRYSDGDFEDSVPASCVRAAEGSPSSSPVRGGSPGAPGRGQHGQPSKDPADRAASRGPPPPRQQQRPGGASASPDRRDRRRMSSAASSDEGEQAVAARLWCVYAQGVELGQLAAQQRSLLFPQRGAELVVGRTAQPSAFWDTLVPDRRLHGTVSREHFKVICMSLNGCLLNSRYLAQGSSERPLQHGDVVALAASTEPPSAQRSDVAPARKSFVVFTFETKCSSPAVPDAAPAVPSPPQPPLAAPPDGDEAQRPPAGTLAGRWRTSEAATGVPSEALFCLEVHGGHAREDLPAEARQLFFCCDVGEAALPSLRVGRHYQRGFWQRAVQPSLLASSSWAAALDVDHFDIRALRRSNPASSEPPDYRFRLRVVGPSGVVLNYSAPCGKGEELDLGPSDTLTLGSSLAPLQGAPAGGLGAPGALPGLHFTFIPLAGTLGVGSPLGAGLASPQQPRIGGCRTSRAMRARVTRPRRRRCSPYRERPRCWPPRRGGWRGRCNPRRFARQRHTAQVSEPFPGDAGGRRPAGTGRGPGGGRRAADGASAPTCEDADAAAHRPSGSKTEKRHRAPASDLRPASAPLALLPAPAPSPLGRPRRPCTGQACRRGRCRAGRASSRGRGPRGFRTSRADRAVPLPSGAGLPPFLASSHTQGIPRN